MAFRESEQKQFRLLQIFHSAWLSRCSRKAGKLQNLKIKGNKPCLVQLNQKELQGIYYLCAAEYMFLVLLIIDAAQVIWCTVLW